MLPNLRELIVLPDTAHMSPLERPHEISRVLVGLADEAVPAGPAGPPVTAGA
jgi:pimeloyl-ACP methyl ester carboxylesterase